MLAKYNFHGKIHNWTHQSQVEMWWSWVFTLGTAKYIFFSCHSYNSSLCNTENIRPESGILILLIFSLSPFILDFQRRENSPANWLGEFSKFYKNQTSACFFFLFLHDTVQSFWQTWTTPVLTLSARVWPDRQFWYKKHKTQVRKSHCAVDVSLFLSLASDWQGCVSLTTT